MAEHEKQKRRWRYYESVSGRKPAREFIDALTSEVRREIFAEMKMVRDEGMKRARHLRGDLYEVRVSHSGNIYRVIFSREGSRHHILLALESFQKKTQKTPAKILEAAEKRLHDWRSRAK